MPKLAGHDVPGWVLRVVDTAKRYGADIDTVLGCGHYGCVFPFAKDERWVIKVTRDATERPMWKWIMGRQKSGEYAMDAFAFVKDVKSAGKIQWQGKQQPITVIKREIVEPSSDVIYSSSERSSLKNLNYASIAGERFHELKSRHMKEMALSQYIDAAGYAGDDFPLVAEAMQHLTGQGVVFRDIHAGNVGRSVVNWGSDVRPPGTWVIFDPGHTPILDPDEVWQ